MASLAVGGLFASKALFKYNRKNFILDKTLKQLREFQEQNMKMEQFDLYREDVRDLVELTAAKMDLYLIVAALLADKTMMMITKQNEALPPGSPEWAVALNALSLASAVLYLLLCLWLALYASISAQSFGVRLLTQFVRLPYVNEEQLKASSAQGVDYEGKTIREMLRVPIAQRHGPGTTDEPGESAGLGILPRSATGASSSSSNSTRLPYPVAVPENESVVSEPTEAASGAGPASPENILPTAMLDHIRLYRRVQLNWQAYDAYARVSLFAGANSVLYSCLYWALGRDRKSVV